ncbi:MAG: hypothetical protein IKG47_04065 [Oscillospiraceae bacterium]|nr:hypothetical protein [Oscillospiraceae bacterium]
MYLLIKTILLILLVLVTVKASFSDFSSGLVHNKDMLFFGIVITILSFMYTICFFPEYVTRQLVNVCVSVVLSLVLYACHIWGGGDSKLAVVMSLAVPVDLFCELDTPYISLIIPYIITFAVGFLYLFVSSFADSFRNKKTLDLHINTVNFLKSFLFAFLQSGAISSLFLILRFVLKIEMWLDNQSITIIEVLVIFFISTSSIIPKNIWTTVINGILILVGIIIGDISHYYQITIQSLAVSASVLFIEWFISKYNYQEISVSELEEGMVLAYSSVYLWANSRIRNLPRVTYEDLRSKLNKEECDAIRRWSPHDQQTVWIVKKVRFAIFVSIGFISFVLMELVL